ncbi:oligoendopeptidase F [Mesomycoplasma molare]|uniref:Oligopeptidase F n=1 Tax=Mesomycoplasma molare TaxID=171288 RepID=A0ABY5TY55_9BACT|nr:oligoendopeptidase F [Mesomycoplasma molare]UWD33969.1 oligoendopeptidase F [Mesomycoplasma molare]
MKFYKKIEDVPKKYTFDLESLLENKKIEDIIKEYWKIKNKELDYKDSKYESVESFLYFKKLENKNEIKYNKIINYLSNKLTINSVDEKINQIKTKFENDFDEFDKKNGSEINRIFQNIEKIKIWKEDPRLKDYKLEFEQVIDFKKYKFSDEIETFLMEISRSQSDFGEIFQILSDIETDLGYATSSKGKKIKITQGNYSLLLKNKDRKIRQTAYNSYLDAYYKNKNTYSKLLIQHFTKISVFALKRNFKSSVNFLLSEDYVGEKVIKNLFLNVKKMNKIIQKFEKADKIFFKFKFNEKKEIYDGDLDLFSKKEYYSVEKGQETFLKATKDMGEEYIKVSEKAFSERWIDYMNYSNKASGAYSISNSFGLDKIFISMNWNYTLDSVLTLAHEMGHSLHTYFSNKNQPQNLSDYPIILAEIASIFNELIISDYLLSNSKNEITRFQLLRENINNFISTVIKQTFWANYEYELYKKIDSKENISTFEDLSMIYSDLYKQYFAKKIPNKKLTIYSVIIPHFYYDFYVYKYAIGYIVGSIFFSKYKENKEKELKKYIELFLSAGGKDKPLNILKESEIDLEKEDIFLKSLSVFKKMVNDYIKLGNKIFKNNKNK